MKRIKRKLIVFVALLILVAIGFSLLFICRRNKAVYPVTQPDNSQERTIQENNGIVTVNFGKCTLDIATIFVGFGSTLIEVRGKQGDKCLMYLGGEVENPSYDGRLGTRCEVPISIGKRGFNKSNYGVDFSSIQDYCSLIK